MIEVSQSLLKVLLESILTYSEHIVPLLDLSILVLLLFTLILNDVRSGLLFISICNHLARALVSLVV